MRLILTSGNSIRALQEKAGIRDIAHIPLFCAGSETARRAQAAGFQSVAAVADSAEELAGSIIASKPKNAHPVHVTGEHQAFDLAAALLRAGLSMCTLCVYEMRARRAFEPWLVEEIEAGGIGGVILMSPRTAEIFVSLCRSHGLLDHVKMIQYFCLAESVASKLVPVGPDIVRVAAKPNRTALLSLLKASPPPGHDPVKQR
ncbi:MAG: uroporphyrinogen-III synthase [Rhodomicrobium sp.]|nr:uroporphyrinogen-III synthase [Rhodomicrobium sp.]